MAAWLIRAFGAAVADVRQKAVEEAWFGRTVTPRPFVDHGNAASDRSPAEKLGWDRPDRAEAHAPQQDQDRGIDR